MTRNNCLYCIHYDVMATCPAFPNGIPEDIWGGENDHEKPTEDQLNTIVFEPSAKQPDLEEEE